MGDVGDGSSAVNAICSRPEVPDDVICGDDVHTLIQYPDVNLWAANCSSFDKNKNQPLV